MKRVLAKYKKKKKRGKKIYTPNPASGIPVPVHMPHFNWLKSVTPAKQLKTATITHNPQLRTVHWKAIFRQMIFLKKKWA